MFLTNAPPVRRLHDSKAQQVPDGLLFGTMPEDALGERPRQALQDHQKKGGAEQLYAINNIKHPSSGGGEVREGRPVQALLKRPNS